MRLAQRCYSGAEAVAALEIVRGARATRRPTPAIVVSGFASEAARKAALDAGAADVFAKPFQAATLAARVRELAR